MKTNQKQQTNTGCRVFEKIKNLFLSIYYSKNFSKHFRSSLLVFQNDTGRECINIFKQLNNCEIKLKQALTNSSIQQVVLRLWGDRDQIKLHYFNQQNWCTLFVYRSGIRYITFPFIYFVFHIFTHYTQNFVSSCDLAACLKRKF